MREVLPQLIIIVAAIAGILIAAYIRSKKTSHQVLVCPLKSNCETVTHSEFSHFFGIPVEVLGIGYYALTIASYVAFIALPALAGTYAVFTQLLLAIVAFLFSLYLTFIQAFTLKQWCTWCLFSAGLCTLIFSMALWSTDVSFNNLLLANHRGIVALHLVGLALGLGGATITDIFFFRFIKDFRISHEEASVMNTLSQVIWTGLAMLILTGIGLYLPNQDPLNHSSKFLLKMVVVAVILVNGAVLNLKVAPQLIHITFGGPHALMSANLTSLRRLSFALGAISMTSWYSAFLLGMTRTIPLPFSTLLAIYGCVLLAAIVASQLTERFLTRPKN